MTIYYFKSQNIDIEQQVIEFVTTEAQVQPHN